MPVISEREDSSMAYSESLVRRIRHVLGGHRGMTEKKMFGGVGFLLDGNMCVGVWKSSLIVRLGPEQAEAAMQELYVVPFDVTGRVMKAWAMVEPDGLETDQQLSDWIQRAANFVRTLPRK
jgi:TfoX/Sxy family transcriptional regulator of competence genes